jgi:predicted  nucleic acid-binding Zn-ribbon protein
MDKQLIVMMGKMMEQMNGVQSDVQSLKTELKDMKTDIQGLKTEMKDMKTDIQGLKTEMHERFDAVDTNLNGVGHQFEELSKNTVQLREDMKKELKYITYKIHALDREVFIRTDSLH